jgi:LysR family transcriptional activator of nhaA
MVFSQVGLGLTPVRSVIAQDIQRRYKLKYVGRLPEIKERFYAISLDRKIKHPAVSAILEQARTSFFR